MTGAQRYVKKPIEVEAIEWSGENRTEVFEFLAGHGYIADHESARMGQVEGDLYIRTLEGPLRAVPGDWIIKGAKGEFCPCKPDVFEATYHRALDEGEGTEVNVLHRVATADDGSQTCERCGLVLVEPPDVGMGLWADGATVRETRPGAYGSERSLTEVGDAAPTCSRGPKARV